MSYSEGFVGTNSWCPNGIDWTDPIWYTLKLRNTSCYFIEYKKDSVVIEIPVPKVKGDEIKLELVDNQLQVNITTDSCFVDVKDFTIDLAHPVKSKTNAVLEYGVLTVTLEKAFKDKIIEVEEK